MEWLESYEDGWPKRKKSGPNAIDENGATNKPTLSPDVWVKQIFPLANGGLDAVFDWSVVMRIAVTSGDSTS
jgi:hypothetical protein